MGVRSLWRSVVRFFTQPHRDVKSFESEVEARGIAGRSEGGMRTIPAAKIVGSVGRAQNLRSDFFYRSGKITARFKSIGRAMEEGKVLPPIEVYKARVRRQQGSEEKALTEYYVVDGHHRVAMAKRLGQDYLDAHVVEYKIDTATPVTPLAPLAPEAPAAAAIAGAPGASGAALATGGASASAPAAPGAAGAVAPTPPAA